MISGPVVYLSEKVHGQWEKTLHIDGLVQERRNSIANAMELRLSCTNL